MGAARLFWNMTNTLSLLNSGVKLFQEEWVLLKKIKLEAGDFSLGQARKRRVKVLFILFYARQLPAKQDVEMFGQAGNMGVGGDGAVIAFGQTAGAAGNNDTLFFRQVEDNAVFGQAGWHRR